jgi:hypothetical protein
MQSSITVGTERGGHNPRSGHAGSRKVRGAGRSRNMQGGGRRRTLMSSCASSSLACSSAALQPSNGEKAGSAAPPPPARASSSAIFDGRVICRRWSGMLHGLLVGGWASRPDGRGRFSAVVGISGPRRLQLWGTSAPCRHNERTGCSGRRCINNIGYLY